MTEPTQFRQVGDHIWLHNELEYLAQEMVILASNGSGMHPHLDNIRTLVRTNVDYSLDHNKDENSGLLFRADEARVQAANGLYSFGEISYELAREWEYVFRMYLIRAGFTLMAEREGQWQTDRLEIRRKELKELGKY